MKTRIIALSLLTPIFFCQAIFADEPWVLFSDNFNRASDDPPGIAPGNNWVTTGAGTSGIVTMTDGGGSQKPSLLLQHGGSGLNVSFAQSTSNFDDPNGWFNPQLASSLGPVTWSFNMASMRSNALRSMGDRGIAAVLAASSSDFDHEDTFGYAVVWGGNSDQTLGLSLVWFDAGLSALGNNYTSNQIINVDLANEALRPFVVNDDTGNGYAAYRSGFSIQASFNPSGNAWTLHARNEGLESAQANFADPLDGSLTLIGSASHSAYTSDSLEWTGFWGIDDTSNTQARRLFDNFSVQVIPEPSIFALLAGLLAIAAAGLYRRR